MKPTGVTGFQFFGVGVHLDTRRGPEGFDQAAKQFWSYYQHIAATADISITVNQPVDWRPLAMFAAEEPHATFEDWTWRIRAGKQILCGPGCVIIGQTKGIDVYLRDHYAHDLRNLVHFALNFALIERLRHFGLFYVHAACLRSPEGKTYLIAGDAGQGKSTITASLLTSGYKYLSDDAVFLDTRAGTTRVLGYQKAFHLGADLIMRYEDSVLRHAYAYGAKWEVDPEYLFPGQSLRSISRIDFIVIPEISRATTSGFTPVRPVDSLLNFFKTSTQVFFDPTLAKAHLEALREVAIQARGYRFAAGIDVYYNPNRYAEYLNELACTA